MESLPKELRKIITTSQDSLKSFEYIVMITDERIKIEEHYVNGLKNDPLAFESSALKVDISQRSTHNTHLIEQMKAEQDEMKILLKKNQERVKETDNAFRESEKIFKQKAFELEKQKEKLILINKELEDYCLFYQLIEKDVNKTNPKWKEKKVAICTKLKTTLKQRDDFEVIYRSEVALMETFIQDYNSVLKSKYEELVEQQNELRNKIHDLARKQLVFEVNQIRNIQYDLDNVIKQVDSRPSFIYDTEPVTVKLNPHKALNFQTFITPFSSGVLKQAQEQPNELDQSTINISTQLSDMNSNFDCISKEDRTDIQNYFQKGIIENLNQLSIIKNKNLKNACHYLLNSVLNAKGDCIDIDVINSDITEIVNQVQSRAQANKQIYISSRSVSKEQLENQEGKQEKNLIEDKKSEEVIENNIVKEDLIEGKQQEVEIKENNNQVDQEKQNTVDDSQKKNKENNSETNETKEQIESNQNENVQKNEEQTEQTHQLKNEAVKEEESKKEDEVKSQEEGNDKSKEQIENTEPKEVKVEEEIKVVQENAEEKKEEVVQPKVEEVVQPKVEEVIQPKVEEVKVQEEGEVKPTENDDKQKQEKVEEQQKEVIEKQVEQQEIILEEAPVYYNYNDEQNQAIFLIFLENFRQSGKSQITAQQNNQLVAECFRYLDELIIKKDILQLIKFMPLTFAIYRLTAAEKVFIQDKIKHHIIWTQNDVWEALIFRSICDELSKLDPSIADDECVYRNTVYSNLATIGLNMLKFRSVKQNTKNLLGKLALYYGLPDQQTSELVNFIENEGQNEKSLSFVKTSGYSAKPNMTKGRIINFGQSVQQQQPQQQNNPSTTPVTTAQTTANTTTLSDTKVNPLMAKTNAANSAQNNVIHQINNNNQRQFQSAFTPSTQNNLKPTVQQPQQLQQQHPQQQQLQGQTNPLLSQQQPIKHNSEYKPSYLFGQDFSKDNNNNQGKPQVNEGNQGNKPTVINQIPQMQVQQPNQQGSQINQQQRPNINSNINFNVNKVNSKLFGSGANNFALNNNNNNL